MRLARRVGIAAIIAVGINAGIRTVVRAVANVPDDFDPFRWPPVIVAKLAGIGGAVVVYLTMRAFLGTRANRLFVLTGYAVMVLSLRTPATLLWSVPPQYPGTSLLTVVSLELMHITTGVAAIAALTGTHKNETRG